MSLANNPNILSGSAPNAAAITAALAASGVNAVTTIYGAGTNYTLTTTDAAITFGTTSPQVTIPATGTYFIVAVTQLDTLATTATTQTVTVKVRRTNNIPADLPNSTVTIRIPAVTGLTHTLPIIQRGVLYAATAGDTLATFTNLSAALGAGSVQAVSTGTYISAWRLY